MQVNSLGKEIPLNSRISFFMLDKSVGNSNAEAINLIDDILKGYINRVKEERGARDKLCEPIPKSNKLELTVEEDKLFEIMKDLMAVRMQLKTPV